MCLCIIETWSPDGGNLTTGCQLVTAASSGALISDGSQHIKYTLKKKKNERRRGGLQIEVQAVSTGRHEERAHLRLVAGKSGYMKVGLRKKVLTLPSRVRTALCLHMLRQEDDLKQT